MLKDIKQFLLDNSNSSFIFEEDNTSLKVVEEVNNVPSFESYFVLNYLPEQNIWEIISVIRNNRRLLKRFEDENVAYFAFVSVVIKYSTKPVINKPNISSELDLSNENNISKINKLLNSIIDERNYSIFSPKHNAVVLLKQNSIYVVYYYDNEGCEFVISDDNEDFDIGVTVLFNHAWYLYLLEQLVTKWPYEIKKDSKGYEEIKKLMLRIK
ncbi:hypothetical protein AB3N04_13010 [Alkalihalophilus sp. As8PL]|uniref:Uncharacterized protein n=1 Tax=Alkalihalophilus sp. As8PL TaxID=3237103 RepID=A0AB39BQD5_9BACI